MRNANSRPTIDCGSEQVGHGPPEQAVHLPDATPYTRYSATWAGVAMFLDDYLRETDAPDLTVDALLADRYVEAVVETDEASSFVVVVLVDGIKVGRTSVPIYRWGADAAPGQPAPYATTIKIPISKRDRVARGGKVTVQVTARDRVANKVTVRDTFVVRSGADG